MRESSNYAANGHTPSPQQLLVILLRNVATQDWSVVINGHRYDHVTTEALEALVECELIVAETFLINEHDHGLALEVP
jgi:hypothetical protein